MSAEGLVSVILPVLNAERYVGEALDSILGQTYSRLEVLAIDGGSTDGTEVICRAHDRVRWMTQQGEGLAAAWNTGLAAATGEFIAFQDSDDRWTSDKLEQQVAHLAAHPDEQYVVGLVHLFVEPGTPLPPGMLPDVFDKPQRGRMPGTLLTRRSVFDLVGVFDPGFGVTTDIDWFARLEALGVPGGMVERVILHKRFHAANLSVMSGATRYVQYLPRLFKQALDLRRKQDKSA